MNKLTQDTWKTNEWRRRLMDGAMHRYERGLTQTPVWRNFAFTSKPTNRAQWQFALLFALASGMDDIAALALTEGASALETICEQSTAQPEFAYIWNDTLDLITQKSVPLATPIQIAHAGGSHQCIQQLFDSGVPLDDAVDWLTPLPPCLPRIHAGLILVEVMLHHPETISPYVQSLKQWLDRAKKYGWEAANAHAQNRKQSERINKTNQHLNLVSSALHNKHIATP